MVEYIYDAIRAVAGQDIIITAIITDAEEQLITTGCNLVFYNTDEQVIVDGVYLEENLMWEFTIPAAATSELEGRYWYCIQHEGQNMSFKQPIYLM